MGVRHTSQQENVLLTLITNWSNQRDVCRKNAIQMEKIRRILKLGDCTNTNDAP